MDFEKNTGDQYKYRNVIFLCLFLVGAWIRSLDVWRPADGRVRESWRECDYAAIARNYYREGMNIFYPRIDWRGDGPGYAEMEFPIFPWSVAVLYKIFGYNERWGRILAFFFSLLTLMVFFKLVRYLLEPVSAQLSSLFFVLSPLLIRISNSLQPEGLMLLCYILSAYAFIRWLDDERWIWFWTALAFATTTILVKAPAAHIGFFFLGLLLSQKGVKSLLEIRIWVFGFFALLPSLLWYFHAHQFWLIYGNSLGVSNEYHWIGLDLLKNPSYLVIFIRGLVTVEILNVWMPLGGVMAFIAIWLKRTERTIKINLLWLTSILIYYIITIRTTADNWAAYYHVVTVPPAALLIGKGGNFLFKRLEKKKPLVISISLSLGISLALILGRHFFGLSYPRAKTSGVIILFLAVGLAIVPFNDIFRPREKTFPSVLRLIKSDFMSYMILFCFSSVFLFQGFFVSRGLHPDENQKKYECAQLFKPFISENALILASGSNSKDWTGYPVASNPPYMFFWLDRKGFNINDEDQSIDKIRDFIDRGVRYFVLEKSKIDEYPQFKDELMRKFILLKECEEAYLFELTKNHQEK